MMHLEHALEEARKSLARGRPLAAHAALETWLVSEAPHAEAHTSSQLGDLMALMHTAAERGALALASPARKQLGETLVHLEPNRLERLGSALIDTAAPRLAAGLLALGHQAFPKDERLLGEYVAALQLDGAHTTAWRVLEAAAPAHGGFLVHYLHAFEAMVGGHVEEARRLSQSLEPGDDPARRFMADRMKGMLRRHEVASGLCALDADDARGWHFVLTGGLLLHVARREYGEVLHGHYLRINETARLAFEVLTRLELVLDALGVPKPALLPLDQVDSRVLGLALGHRWGLDPKPALEASEPGLVVAYDLEAIFPKARSWHERHRPAQMLFAQASCHRREQRATPDLLGYLYEQRTPAWEPSLGAIDEDARARVILEAELAKDALADAGDLVALAVLAQAEGVLAALRDEGTREPLWVSGH